nr:ferredoxin reductase family protein [Streptomyces sp. ODS25]
MTLTQSPAPVRHRAPRPARHRSPALPLLAAAWAGGLAVLALWWQDTDAVIGTAGWLTGAGRIAGLLSGYMCALLVVLMARVPLLEQRVGSDRVARWHASAGRWTICLLVAHIVLITLGYAAQGGAGPLAELDTIVFHYPEMLKGAAGAVVLIVVGVVSARAVRRRVRYEVWYYLHVLTYAAVFLAFGHQLALGADLSVHPGARAAWYVLYVGAAALVSWFRVLAPVRLNLRHRLRVVAVVREAPGVTSVWMSGRRMDELTAAPGQFLRWRFLTGGMWWTSHPYSLSAPPAGGALRITVKALGDHSAALALLPPGTRVWAAGPYGALTPARRRRRNVLLIAGGTGITPLRTLFEALPADAGDLTLLYRARTPAELALRGELERIAQARGARVHYVLNAPDGRRTVITADALLRLLPDVRTHDVYLCGPPGFAQAVYDALRAAKVPARQIHHESFAL